MGEIGTLTTVQRDKLTRPVTILYRTGSGTVNHGRYYGQRAAHARVLAMMDAGLSISRIAIV